MKSTLGNFWNQFVAAGAPARWAVAAVLAVGAIIGGFSFYQSRNPHFEVLMSNLDEAEYTRAVTALSKAGIRFDTTMPPGPFTIFVETKRKYDALNAIHLEGGFSGPTRGIDPSVSGATAAFLGQDERNQRTAKRDWQETELQLENLVFVASAFVKVSSNGQRTFLGSRPEERHAIANVTLRGGAPPDAVQRRTLAQIVSASTGVPLANVTVCDHLGNMLFEGGDGQSADAFLAMEQQWRTDMERRIQAKLDQTFGPGLTVVGVSGEWSHVRQESVEETLDAAKKPRSKRTLKTEGGSSAATNIGGPAGGGMYPNSADAASGADSRSAGTTNSTSESEESNVFGQRTTHSVSQPHVLERLSLSLIVDTSLNDRLEQAEKAVKAMVGFDLARGDTYEGIALELHGLERDDAGKPVLPTPEPPPAPANPLISKLLEHGIEIVAAVAFLFVLSRSLKGAANAARGVRPGSNGTGIDPVTGVATVKLDAEGKPLLSDLLGDEEVDLDLLARKHVEELLEREPEKVSALLSRWALGEQFYAGAGKG
jgi:flagellar biosynthesis/type III secretory pathway M-ring protein FliF/YscJ